MSAIRPFERSSLPRTTLLCCLIRPPCGKKAPRSPPIAPGSAMCTAISAGISAEGQNRFTYRRRSQM